MAKEKLFTKLEPKEESKEEVPPFFESLHRPLQQNLKSTRWVCEFIFENSKDVKPSSLNIEFYLYLIEKLSKVYKNNEPIEYIGVSSKVAILAVVEFFEKNGKVKKIDKIKTINSILLKKKRFGVEKQVYSTYKAASYYVNLSKDKLGFINSKSQLTNSGKELLAIRTKKHLTQLTEKEQFFYFKTLIRKDFTLFLSLCLFKRIEHKLKINDVVGYYFDFVLRKYGIKHFNYTNKSLLNYTNVREAWIDQINVLNKIKQIRLRYQLLLEEDVQLSSWFKNLLSKFDIYVNENLKASRELKYKKEQLVENYIIALRENKDVQGFVNLYDIKSNMKLSFNSFNKLLNEFYEEEKSKRHIFFSNIVSSIDRRERFVVRGQPVLKIKFKHKI